MTRGSLCFFALACLPACDIFDLDADKDGCQPLDGTAAVAPRHCFTVTPFDEARISHEYFFTGSNLSGPTGFDIQGAPQGVTVFDTDTPQPKIRIGADAPASFELQITGINECSRGPTVTNRFEVYRGPVYVDSVAATPHMSAWGHNTPNDTFGPQHMPAIVPDGDDVYVMGGGQWTNGNNEGTVNEIWRFDTTTLTAEYTGVDLPFDGARVAAAWADGADHAWIVNHVPHPNNRQSPSDSSLWKFTPATLTFEEVPGVLAGLRNTTNGANITWMQYAFEHDGDLYIGPGEFQFFNEIKLLRVDTSTMEVSFSAPFDDQRPTGNLPPSAVTAYQQNGRFYYMLYNGFVMEYDPATDTWDQHELNSPDYPATVAILDRAYVFREEKLQNISPAGQLYSYIFGFGFEQNEGNSIGIRGQACQGDLTNFLESPCLNYVHNGNVYMFACGERRAQASAWFPQGL